MLNGHLERREPDERDWNVIYIQQAWDQIVEESSERGTGRW